jgi:NlpC/P60 family/Bacterial dipeptidyl-peptidase Sh3 domain
MPSKCFYTGPKEPLDPRINAFRADLADAALRDVINVAHYSDPVSYSCTAPFVPMHEEPGGEQCSELLFGEHFMVLDIAQDLAWGWSAHDHYVGYVAARVLEPIDGESPRAARDNPLDVARSFLGTPYVWGGRGGAGIDCSGLVQRSVAALGVSAMRDSDMQRDTLGRWLGDEEPTQAGDIVFFPGHVGLMIDADTMIHATIFHKKTVVEAINVALPRIIVRNDGVGIVARRRIDL